MVELQPHTFEGDGDGDQLDKALMGIFGEVARNIRALKMLRGELPEITDNYRSLPHWLLVLTDEKGRERGWALFRQDSFGNFFLYVAFYSGVLHVWVRVGVNSSSGGEFRYLRDDSSPNDKGSIRQIFLLNALDGWFNAKDRGDYQKARIMEDLVLQILERNRATNNKEEALRSLIQMLQESGLLTPK